LAQCDRIIVSTDMEHTVAQPPTHEWLPRPTELAQDDTPMIAVVQHAIETVQLQPEDILVLLQPTQPFRTPGHVTAAIELLRETQAGSVVSVVQLPQSHHPEAQLAMSEVLMPGRLVPWYQSDWAALPVNRQDSAPTYKRDGTVYAFWRKTVQQYGTIYGQDVRPLLIPPEESCELDTEADWLEVERRWQARHD
jgi:CMP-N,N'-diacetyllegionaminic acid synthase